MDGIKVQRIIEKIRRLKQQEKEHLVELLVKNDQHLAEDLLREIEARFADQYFQNNEC
jgi:division protein CdvB (Snf7/Vps24/ESCRT-III family)|tara:strand:+ start:952 stop:1125 length:174 start_codon:yes stop_codon:yes gene_type:complete